MTTKPAESKERSEGDHPLLITHEADDMIAALQCCETDVAKMMISKALEDVYALDYSFELAVINLEAQKQAKTSGQKDYEDEEIRTLAPKDRGT